MTEQTPPPPPTEAPALVETPVAPARRSRKGLVIGGIALVVVLALAGGAFAIYQKLDGGGPQPHDVLPASVVAYARVDLDPSAGQKIALLKLIRQFPDAAKEIGITSADQDVRELLVKEALEQADCGLTYDKDVEPWLGNRLGLGLDKDQTPLVAIQVTDEGKAEKGIKALFECAGEDASVAFLDGYAIVAEEQKGADAAVKAATTSPLADKKAFIDDNEDLGEQGVASVWADFSAVGEIPGLKDGLAGALGAQGDAALDEVGTGAAALRVDGSTLELAGLTGLSKAYDLKAAPIGTLPADTVAALSIGGIGDQIAAQYDALLDGFTSGFASALGGPTAPDPSITEGMTPEEKDAYEKYFEDSPIETPDPRTFIAEFESATGLKLPADLETLFGDGLTVAVGSANLERVPTLRGPDDVAALDVALQMTTDPAKAIDLAQRLAALASQAGIALSTAQTDDGAVIATNQDAADALGSAGKLGDESAFESVMPYGDKTVNGLYVNVRAILDKLLDANPPESIADDIKEARKLSAVGISLGKDREHSLFSLRVDLAD
jgi:hypothetical protein